MRLRDQFDNLPPPAHNTADSWGRGAFAIAKRTAMNPSRTFPPAARRARPRWVRAVALLSATLMAWLGGGSALAEETLVLTLVDLSQEEAATREIAADMVRVLKKTKNVRFVDLDGPLNLGGEEIQTSSAKAGDQAFKAAMAKLEAGDHEAAADEFQNAVENYAVAYAVLADLTIYPRALLMLGVAQLLSGDPKGADKTFEKAVQADQKVAVETDLGKYSPKAQAALVKARNAVAARESVEFEIKTDQPNARVYVNGRSMGLTPTYATSTKGDQLIALAKQGFARKMRKVAVDKSGVLVEEKLDPARRAAALESLRKGLVAVAGGASNPEVLSEAEGLLGTPMVLLLSASGTREKMRVSVGLANLSSRQVINQVTRDIKWESRDKVTREQIDKLVDDVLKPRVIVAPTGPGVVEAKPIYAKWWFWTLLAAVAGGSVVAYKFASTTPDTPPAFQKGTGGVLIQF